MTLYEKIKHRLKNRSGGYFGLEVIAPHHDGTNVYTLRALTEAGANRYSVYDDELEQSLIHGSPRTLRRYTKNIKNLWEV